MDTVTVVLCWEDGTWTEESFEVPEDVLSYEWGGEPETAARVLSWLHLEGPLGTAPYRKVVHAWIVDGVE